MEKTQVTRKPGGQEAGGVLVPALGEVLGRYCVMLGPLLLGQMQQSGHFLKLLID